MFLCLPLLQESFARPASLSRPLSAVPSSYPYHLLPDFWAVLTVGTISAKWCRGSFLQFCWEATDIIKVVHGLEVRAISIGDWHSRESHEVWQTVPSVFSKSLYLGHLWCLCYHFCISLSFFKIVLANAFFGCHTVFFLVSILRLRW